MEISIEVSQKTKKKKELLHDPAITLLVMYLKECESSHNTDTCTLIFITALLTTVKLGNQSRCPSTEERIKTVR
jgi:hypothetical protein